MKINNKAFTLVELMVVLLILAILMAVAVPIFLGTRKRAQDNVAKQSLVNSARALSAYYVNEDEFPPRANSSDPGSGDTMKEEIEGGFNYTFDTDGSGAPAFSSPPNLAYDPDNAELRITSQSGIVWVIDITDGEVGSVTSE